MTSWIPFSQANDTPAGTFVEKWRPRPGGYVGLPISTPRWGLQNDRPLALLPPLGMEHPTEATDPKWLMHKSDNTLTQTMQDAPAPVELSKPWRIGEDKLAYSFGYRPQTLRYTQPDWTANQTTLLEGSGYKFNFQNSTTHLGEESHLGGMLGTRCGNLQFSPPTAAADIPNMYVVAQYESRTVRSNIATSGRRFPTFPRFENYYA